MDEVDYVVVTAGSFDILAEVVCEDDDHLLRLLNQHIRTIDGIVPLSEVVEADLHLGDPVIASGTHQQLSMQTYPWDTR